MKEMGKKFVYDNEELIKRKIGETLLERVIISDGGISINDYISLVLTDEFKLDILEHWKNGLAKDVILVIASYRFEHYIVEYHDLKEYLSVEELNSFKNYLLNQETKEYGNDKPKNLADIIVEETEILGKLYEYDEKAYEKLLQLIAADFDINDEVLQAWELLISRLNASE